MVMSFRLKCQIPTPINTKMWTTSMTAEDAMSFVRRGSSKKLRQAAMCVVNRNGRMGSKTCTSRVPMRVNKMIKAMVTTIGPRLFEENPDKVSDNVLTVSSAR